MRKPKLSTKPPKLTALIGRASPRGSHNFGGLNKGIDMPNQSAQSAADMSPLGVPSQNFCKGGKVISSRNH